MSRGHAEHLMVMIREVLFESGVNFSKIDLLAVTNGPGGFTGLRVGLAAARGISLAGGLACIGISNLEVVANGVSYDERDSSHILSTIDTKREDIYIQIFTNASKGSSLQPLGEPQAILPENLAAYLHLMLPVKNNVKNKILVVGDAAERSIKKIRESGNKAVAGKTSLAIDARGVALIAANQWNGSFLRESLQPLYLRSPDATIPINSGRLRP